MKKVIAVDFDGTLFEDRWPEIGAPIWPVINAAKREMRNGAELILWTTREGEKLSEAVMACDNVGLYFEAINSNTFTMKSDWGNDPRKVGATEYWDDRAVRVGTLKERAEDAAAGLPCRIGDMVWCVRNFRGRKIPRPASVTEMFFTPNMRLEIVCKNVGRGFWGEHIFHTQSEAEEKIHEVSTKEEP